jgi:nucleoside-diphosphate-sugar epimerase
VAAGRSGDVVEIAAEQLPADLRQPFDFRYELATDTSRIRKELSYAEPLDRNEALKRTVEWERLHASH